MNKTPDEIKKELNEYFNLDEVKRHIQCCIDTKECLFYTFFKEGCDKRTFAKLMKGAVQQLEAQVPRWISVKDRLPENEKTVLISATRKGVNGKCWHVVMTAFYTDGNLHTEDSSFAWDCEYAPLEYCEETDDYIIPEGWWEAVECGDEFSAVDLFVTHWMPLPEPPEEEENERES